MHRCLPLLLLCATVLSAADHVGVRVAASDAQGFVAFTAEGAETPFVEVPLARIVDLAMADSYRVAEKEVPIRHLAIRVETLDQYGQTKLDVYRVRLSDQSPAAVRRELGAAR